jgi:tetratricopeptide (TPR) repeat protein
MAKRVPFIGREDELEYVADLINDWGTYQIVCLNAPGGIGKTRLLQEVHDQYSGRDDRIFVADIIDFDDLAFQNQENLAFVISQRIGLQHFENYLHHLRDYRIMEQGGVSLERLEREQEKVLQSWYDDFNKFTEKQRVVYFFDTVDAIQEQNVLDYLVANLGSGRMQNSLCLIAGRNADYFWRELRPELGSDVHLIDLPAFSQDYALSYIEQKQELLHVVLDTDLKQKILQLAQGKPILIDLAVEWRARGISLDWLAESDSKKLALLSSDEEVRLQREFERHLVHHLVGTRQWIDWLTLTMSHVYPLDIEMITFLLNISREEAKALFEEAQTSVFVKSLPDGSISLHDEMRRMVNEYVWPEVDPDGDWRRRDSNLAAEYLKHKIKELSRQIRRFEDEVPPQEANFDAEMSLFTKRQELERNLWNLKGRRLRHLLITDLDKGIRIFADLFDRATRSYRFTFRDMLVTRVEKPQFAERFSSEQRYKVDIRRVTHLIDEGKYIEAEDLLLKMLKRKDLLPKQYVESLIQLGNVEVRLGRFEQSISHFIKAVEQSESNDLEEWLLRSENALGWAYRLIGNWERAAERYEKALKYSLRSDDGHQQALILNNLGFARGLQPMDEEEEALPLCKQALAIWENLEYKRGIGQVYCTIGEILRHHNRLDEALNYFNKAAEIFEPADDLEWLSNVYCGRGIVLFLISATEEKNDERKRNYLKRAENDLKKAREIGLRRDEPKYLHYLAHVAEERGNIQKAKEMFMRSYDVSQDIHDLYFEVNNLGDIANVAAIQQEFDRWPEFEKRCQRYQREYPGVLSRDVGLILGYVGDLALGEGNIDNAIQYYKEGLSLLAGSGGYGVYNLPGHLERKEQRWKEWGSEGVVSVEALREVGENLEQYWLEKGLTVAVLPFFARWKKW